MNRIKSPKRSRIELIICLFLILVTAGCAGPAKKPSRALPPAPPPTLEMAEFRQLADKLSTEAVQVKGVSNAIVILQGRGKNINAIVGLVVESGLGRTRQNQITSEVIKKIKQADARIKTVQVTRDATSVKKIKGIAKAVAEGKPVSELQREINEVSRQIGQQ